MNKPESLCDRCLLPPFCMVEYDGEACRKVRTAQPTRYDRLKGMTAEELAKWLSDLSQHFWEVGTEQRWEDMPTEQAWLDWLKMEATDEEN